MSIHRWRAVVDFYADEHHEPERIAALLQVIVTQVYPLGVIEGFPTVEDQDAKPEPVKS